MMKFCAFFHAPVDRFALSVNCRWSRYKIPAFAVGITLAFLFLTGAAGAADVIWDGSSSTSWNDGTNWTLNSSPSLTTDVVRFDNNSAASLNTVNNIVGLSLAGIIQTSAGANNGVAGPVSITGNALTIGGTGLAMVSGNPRGPDPYTQPAQADMTVDVDLTLSADQRWKAGGPGTATTAQASGNQALIVGASANGHTVTLNGFKPTLTVISNQFDQIIVNSTLVDGSKPSQLGIGKATGTTTSINYDTGNINTTTRVRISGNNTYSGGTEIIGGRQIIQLNSNSVAGVSGPLGTGPIIIHTDAPLAGGLPNNQHPYFSPFGADRTLYNDIIMTNVIANTAAVGNPPVLAQSYPTMYNVGSSGDTAHTLTLNGAVSVQTNASVLQNSAATNQTTAAGDLVVNGTVLLGGADFNSDGKMDTGDYVAWRKNSAAHGGADGYRVWRETFGTTIPTLDGNPITTGNLSLGQTASPATAPGRSIINGNILQTNNAVYTVSVQNGSAAMPSMVQLYGQNTYAGGTNLTATDASSPTSPANLGLGSSSTMSGPTILSGPLGTGTLTVGTASVAATSSIESLGGAQTVANVINVPSLTAVLIVRGSNDLNLSGDITGSGSVTMNGTGKLTLSGTNSTFLNFTNVNSGTVLVNGTLVNSGALVATGATVGGSGTIAAGITSNGGTIAPGSSGVGTLTSGTGSVTGNITDNGTSAWAIDLSGTASDLLAVTGSITLSGTDSLNVAGVGSGSSWTIASYTGTLSGTFGSVTAGYSVDYGTGTNSVITLHPVAGSGASLSSVPEPASLTLGMIGVGLASVYRRRRG